jgi:SET domain-containing protein
MSITAAIVSFSQDQNLKIQSAGKIKSQVCRKKEVCAEQPKKMSATILERARGSHELIEKYEREIVHILDEKCSGVSPTCIPLLTSLFLC